MKVNDSLYLSAWHLVKNSAKHWLLVVGGAAAGVVSWVLQAQDAKLPPRAFALGGALAIAVAVVRAYHEVRLNRDRLAFERLPVLDISFLPENVEDSRPYLQTLEVMVLERPIPGVSEMVATKVDRRYRVGVVNLSSATVQGVSVVLERCIPGDNMAHVGHRLLVMDSAPPLGARDVPPSKAGEATAWFDVVNTFDDEGDTPEAFTFCYANPKIRGAVPAGSYEVVLRAEGGGVSTSRQFRIEIPPDGQLTMQPL